MIQKPQTIGRYSKVFDNTDEPKYIYIIFTQIHTHTQHDFSNMYIFAPHKHFLWSI